MSIGWKRGVWLVAVACLLVGAGLVAAAETTDVSGAWALTFQGRQGPRTLDMNLTQKGDELSGSVVGAQGAEMPLTGTVSGNDVEFTVTFKTQRGEFPITYKGTVEGGSMKGTAELPQTSIEWTAERK